MRCRDCVSSTTHMTPSRESDRDPLWCGGHPADLEDRVRRCTREASAAVASIAGTAGDARLIQVGRAIHWLQAALFHAHALSCEVQRALQLADTIDLRHRGERP